MFCEVILWSPPNAMNKECATFEGVFRSIKVVRLCLWRVRVGSRHIERAFIDACFAFQNFATFES